MKDSHQKDKIHFQVERIAFFSDALIAIAVTLLIIEIKAPHIEHGISFSEQVAQLTHLIPEFISFGISFAIIISQWIKHHELFGNIIGYDTKLIRINAAFLFANTIIPFSTSYFAHNTISEISLPYLVYGFTLIFLTFCNYLLFRHAVNPKFKLYSISYTSAQRFWLSADYLLFPIAIIIALLLGYINLKLGLIIYVAMMQLGFFINSKKRKLNC